MSWNTEVLRGEKAKAAVDNLYKDATLEELEAHIKLIFEGMMHSDPCFRKLIEEYEFKKKWQFAQKSTPIIGT